MASTKNNHNEQESNGSDQNQSTKLRFEDGDESMCDAGGDNADVADDITSADYYFDSYSHFGKKSLKFHVLFTFFMFSSPHQLCFQLIDFAGIHEVSILQF